MRTYEERRDEAAYSYEIPTHRNCYGCCQSDSDYENAFKAGADWSHKDLMSDVKKLVKALEFYRSQADCKMPAWIGKCHCSFCKGDDLHRTALADFRDKHVGGNE